MYQKEKERYRFSFKTRENLYLIQFQVQSQTLLIAVFLVPKANFLDQVWYGYPGGQGGGIAGKGLTEPKRLHAHTSCKDCFCIKKSEREHFLWEGGLLSYIAKSGGRPWPQYFGPYRNILEVIPIFWPLPQYFGHCQGAILLPYSSWKDYLEKNFPLEDVSLL